ncbi:MAG: cdaR [Firmicutes bacterium]|nr:cdaR [Bacillota bacterium]
MMDRGSVSPVVARILALFFAIVLWVYVTNEQNPPIEAVFSVPLEVKNVAADLVITEAPEMVRVKVRGSRSVIAALQALDLKAYVDMRGLGEGLQTVSVHAALPQNLELAEVIPEKIQLRLIAMIGRKMPLDVKASGAPAQGKVVAGFTTKPEQVTVEGPSDVVATVDKVLLPLEITGKDSDFSADVTPVTVGKDGREISGLTLYPDKVHIVAKITQGLVKKTVEVKPTLYGKVANEVLLDNVIVKPAQVELTGDPTELSKVDFVYTEPVNIVGVNTSVEKESGLQLKEGITASKKTVVVGIYVSSGR